MYALKRYSPKPFTNWSRAKMRVIQFDAKARKQSVSSAARPPFPCSIDIVAWPVQRRFPNHGKFQKSFNYRKKNYVTLFTRQATDVAIENLQKGCRENLAMGICFLAPSSQLAISYAWLNFFWNCSQELSLRCTGQATSSMEVENYFV